MSSLSFFHLAQPWWLLGALPWLLVVAWAWRARPPTLRVASAASYQQVLARPRGWAWPLRLPLLLEALAGLCVLVALARPQAGTSDTPRRAIGLDLMIVVDISESMKAYDLAGLTGLPLEAIANRIQSGEIKSRIEVARAQVKRFVAQRPNDRIGLIAFAGYAYLACPPTLDHDFLLGRLEQLDAGMFTDSSTNLAAALVSATTRLQDSPARRRVALLFTDGQNTKDALLTPAAAAQLAQEHQVIVHTVGIGSKDAYLMVQSYGGYRFAALSDQYDQTLMEELARSTGGRFFPAANEDGMKRTLDAINELETIPLEQATYVDYDERFAPWLWAAAALLLLALLASATVSRRLP